MNLEELDRMIQERESRIQIAKDKGTLFEVEAEQTNKRIKEMLGDESEQNLDDNIPPCPKCGKIMTYVPSEQMIVCHECHIGARVG